MKSGIILGAAALIAFGGTTPALAQAPDSLMTTLDSVFTAEEAARGKELYLQNCAECHAMDWYKGNVALAWEGVSINGLLEMISTTMPETSPGSLERRQYLDVLAYILELNGLPPGRAVLPTDRTALTRIRFAFPKERGK